MQRCSAPCVNLISEVSYQTDIASSQEYISSSGKKTKSLMIHQMQKLAEQQEFERANSGTFLLYSASNLLSSLVVQSDSEVLFFKTFVDFFFIILLFIVISLIYLLSSF